MNTNLVKTRFLTICLFLITLGMASQLNAEVFEAYDFASYQAAIVSVNAGNGGDIIKITGDIVITKAPGDIKKDVTITSDTNPDGTPKYTMSHTGGYTSIYCTPQTYCTIENIAIDGGGRGISVSLSYSDPSSYPVVKISNCIINNTNSIGIEIGGIEGKRNPVISITNCKINNAGSNGIYIGADPPIYDITIQNCAINKTNSIGIEITAKHLDAASKLNIIDCISNDNKREGIYIMGDGGVFKNCVTNNNGYGGINCRAKSRFYNCTSNGNNGNSGIIINGNFSSGDFQVSDTVIINNCTTNNNSNNGVSCDNDALVDGCISNDNSNRGFSFTVNKSSCGTKLNNCTAEGNASSGFFGLPEKTIITNCVASNNATTGFSGSYLQITNCSAIKNGSSGFWSSGFSIVNNCSAIGNGYGSSASYGKDGFHSGGGTFISNSTAINNCVTGFYKGGGGSIMNCTAYGNSEYGIENYNDSIKVYNSISYGNKKNDISPSSRKQSIYNTVYGTKSSDNVEEFNCTNNNPNLVLINENGDVTGDIEAAMGYILGNGSSALELADKNLITKETIIKSIPKNVSQDILEWFFSIITEEYVIGMLFYDQIGTVREFNGDRYDAGAIASNAGGGSSNLIFSYNPKKAGNYGKATLIFYGKNLDDRTKITLKKQGENDLVPETIRTEYSATTDIYKCFATFNLHNKKIGKWDIIVNVGDITETIKEGFEIETYIEPKIEVELLGPLNIAKGSWTTLTLEYSNKGNVEVYCVPVIIEIITRKEIEVEVKENWGHIYTQGTYTDETGTVDGEVQKLYVLDDFSGNNTHSTFVTPLIPVIPPYGKGSLTFNVQFVIHYETVDEPIEIRAYPLRSLAPMELNGGDEETLWGCLKTVAKIAWDMAKIPLGAIPGVACAIQVAESVVSLAEDEGGTGYKAANAAAEVGKVISECATDFIPGAAGVKTAVKMFKTLSTANDMVGHATGLVECGGGLIKLIARLVGSLDPNDKYGSVSESGSTWFSDRKDFTYVINFENDPKATAPAQQVWITDNLDLNLFDINSFEAGIMKMGDRMITDIPFNTQNCTWTIDMRPEMELITEVKLTLNKSTGVATWYFKSIDPATGELPTDALMGFLPPEDGNGSGQGFVMFTIKLKDGLADDVVITNKASIVF
ncbi:MAG: right-handed parallel beta-helix repeat-containing protein, partial [Bacteroidales bacterium]|nr:right-handed parallel beta-helix repeat-containing protein [Bacteroidales bacterium]